MRNGSPLTVGGSEDSAVQRVESVVEKATREFMRNTPRIKLESSFAFCERLQRAFYALEEDLKYEGRLDMWRDLRKRILPVAEKFIKKVESGRARSKETYADMLAIRKMFEWDTANHPTFHATQPSPTPPQNAKGDPNSLPIK